LVLTISKLKRWSISYYIDTAQTAEQAAKDLARTGSGLGEYYSERETRTPCGYWPATPTPSPSWSACLSLSAPGETPMRSWWRAGSTVASPRMVRVGARSVSAVCTGSI
jgi:hypothetical protein